MVENSKITENIILKYFYSWKYLQLILGLLIGGSCIWATTGSLVTAEAPAGSSSFPAGRVLDYTLTQVKNDYIFEETG